LLNASERVLQRLPIRGAGAELSGRLEEKRMNAERAQGYVEIYGAYTQSEARYRIDRTVALHQSLSPEDQRAFNFDPIDVDWRHYLHNIHMPSIISQGRVRSKPVKKTSFDRVNRARSAILSPQRQMAAFDLENTLIRSNVAESFAWLATRRLSAAERARLVARKLPSAPSLALLDRRDRGDFLRQFYRWYAGAPVEQLREDAQELFSHLILNKAFPEGLRRVREHREAGHRTLLITGALDIVVEPLRELFDDIVCAHMSQHDGVFTGELLEPPPVGEARALVIKDFADRNGLQLGECVAYADSVSDLPMLEAVGHAVVVNPETRLAAIARRRGWHVEQWKQAGSAPIVPMGRLASAFGRRGA
jgi:alcohol-forming fatty acyl-CoA reductase